MVFPAPCVPAGGSGASGRKSLSIAEAKSFLLVPPAALASGGTGGEVRPCREEASWTGRFSSKIAVPSAWWVSSW